MKKTAMDVVKTFKTAVRDSIDGNRNHGWGVKDSVAVIDCIISEFAPAWIGTPEPTDEAAKVGWNADCAERSAIRTVAIESIARVVNPSAFRQYLESDKVNLL